MNPPAVWHIAPLGSATGMTSFGYTLSSEEHDPARPRPERPQRRGARLRLRLDLRPLPPVGRARRATARSCGPCSARSPTRTERIEVGVGVTCPIMRIHPAVLAQAAATTSLLFEGRFFFGVGTGEALNEHVARRSGGPGPRCACEMLEEAVDVIRQLWTGETVDHRGALLRGRERAPLRPAGRGRSRSSSRASGPEAATLAGRIGDGYWGNSPDAELLDAFEAAGGSGPRYAQLNAVLGDRRRRPPRKTVHEIWPNAGVPGQLVAGPADVDALRAGDRAAHRGAGHEVGAVRSRHRRRARRQRAASTSTPGYDHLYFHQIGPDQDGFFGFWARSSNPPCASDRRPTSPAPSVVRLAA